jgi:hypothetical protein
MTEKEITQAVIDDWKNKYGEVYKIDLGGDEFYYRPLKRAEYKAVLQSQGESTSFREEQIVQKCLIYPEIDAASTGATKAGIISTLTDCIMMVSGFGVDSEPVKL